MTSPTWNEKLARPRQPKRVILDKDFAGIKKGTRLFVGTPQLVDAYIRRIPEGETRTIERMRRDLARRHQCEATCPVSTAIFIRISAEAAIEAMKAGSTPDRITPFWRLVDPDSTLARKLDIDANWIAAQRAAETTPVKRRG